MNLHLEFKTIKPESTNYLLGGIQYKFKFDNNYGASVIKHNYSYGAENDQWELAVLYYDDNGVSDICYSTEITQDVLGAFK